MCRAHPSSSIMSTNKSLGDRSDVPDLLKSLADYPFPFPDFEDTGKFFKKYSWDSFRYCLEILCYLNRHGVIQLFSDKATK